VSEWYARRRKDGKIATFMGWIGVGQRRTGSLDASEEIMGLSDLNQLSVSPVPHYTQDLGTVAAAEAKIASMGLGDAYIAALANLCGVGYDQSMRAFALDLMRATPEQRVDALLRVIEVTL